MKKQDTKKNSKKKVDNGLRRELISIIWVFIGIFVWMSLFFPTNTGVIGGFIHRTTTTFVGRGAYLLPLIIVIFCLSNLKIKGNQLTKLQTHGIIVLFLIIISLFHLPLGTDKGLDHTCLTEGGGVLGLSIVWVMEKFFAEMGSYLILSMLALVSLLVIFNKSLVMLSSRLVKVLTKQYKEKMIDRSTQRQSENEYKRNSKANDRTEVEDDLSEYNCTREDQPSMVIWDESLEHSSSIDKSIDICDNNSITIEVSKNHTSYIYPLPSPTLLFREERSQTIKGRKEIHQSTKVLEDTLLSFGVNAKVVKVSRGPAITRYEVQPAPGVKVSKIVNLADDIALSMAAADVRIEAPIPNKSAVGIEVPNKEVAIVYIRELIEIPDFHQQSSKLSIALGKDVAGGVVIADLQKMPHMLIAGATGTGKSVCINTIICSLLFRAQPYEVKLLMIDPKVVELNVYNNIPHLISPVVTDPKKAASALRWVVLEMENRYSLFASVGARDLQKYNEHLAKQSEENLLPYIVVVIDELADLMMVAPNDVEDAVCRLAQMARAAGIHLVIATQRPSVDVITGLIKANIPSRISFSVSSQIDSRTILDMGGAEKLLGKGDMLYYPSGASKPIRVQGCFISDKEVETVTQFWKKQGEPEYTNEVFKVEVKEEKLASDDDLFVEALRLVLESNQASVSLLQRRLRIGYTRAARLIDTLEEKGYVGPYEGSKPREVLATSDSLRMIEQHKEKNK